MKRKITNKGFSLVELLAVIVILGILGVISIAAVNVVLDKAEKNYYETQEKNLLSAAKSYVQDNRNVLPKNVGDTRVITLEELQKAKYIEKILDRSKNECTEGSVTVFKYSQNDYSYKPYLKCSNWESGKTSGSSSGNSESEGPTISLSINTDYNDPSFTYQVTTTGDAKIISYSYQIYKHGVLVQDSGSIPVSKVSSLDGKKVSLKEFVPGEFEIVFKASDIYGKTNTVTENTTIKTENGPECGEVYPALNYWTNTESVSVNVTCIDKTGAGCAKEVFSQIFTTESKTNYIEISDNVGNKTTCQVDTYIDKTAPEKPVITNPYENTWINKSYSISVVSMDRTSGIAYFEYRYPDSSVESERNWTTYANSSRVAGDSSAFTTTNFSKERNEAVEIRACDYAGNCSEPTRSIIKIDKTSPTCSVTKNISSPNGQNGWYVSNLNFTLNANDTGGSDISARDLTTSSTATYAGNTTATQGNTTGVTYYGYVRDAAGNVGSCNSEAIKIDTTKPACSITKTGTGGSGGVYTSQVSLKLNVSDGTSGVSSYGMANNSSVAYNGTSTGTQGATNGITWYGVVIDNAGNTNTCNTGNFQVLLKPPVITFSLSGSTSTATCTDGNTGAAIAITSGATKTLTTSSLTHTVTCTNSSGQSTTSSKTYTATCSKSEHICYTCHGNCCGSTCYYGCAYDCNCYDQCAAYTFK